MGPAKLLSAAALSTLLITTTQAGIQVVPTQPAILPGYTAYGIYWDGGGSEDWTSADLIADLTQGTFYQTPGAGADGPPTEFVIRLVPVVEFDTYVGIIEGEGNAIAGNAGNLAVWEPMFSDQRINVSWYNNGTTDTGYVKIGNFTVTNDAIGTWLILSSGETYSGIITPEPASFALLALTCPALFTRRNHT